MKHLTTMVLTVLLVFTSFSALAHEPFMITLAVPEEEGSLLANTAFYLNELIDMATGEGILFDVYFKDELGTNEELIDDVLNNGEKVGMLMIPVDELARRGLVKASVLTAPYLFTSHEQFMTFAATGDRKEWLEEFKSKHIKAWGLGFFENGFVHLPSSLGSQPGDLASALSADRSAGISLVSGQEAQPQAGDAVTLTGHGLRMYMLVMPDNMWEMLVKKERKLMIEICQVGAEYNAKLAAASEERAIAGLEASGVTFVSPENPDAWREAAAEAIREAVGGETRLYDSLLNLK